MVPKAESSIIEGKKEAIEKKVEKDSFEKEKKVKVGDRACEESPVKDMLLEKNETSLETTIWLTVLGVSACLDYMAKMLGDWEKVKERREQIHRNPFHFHQKQEGENVLKDVEESLIMTVVGFLDKYSIPIGLLFSILWLSNAFVKAQRRRDKKLHQIRREKIMSGNYSKKQEEEESQGAWWTFYRTVFVELVLLPIGFYLLIYHLLALHSDQVHEFLVDDDEQIEINFYNQDGTINETISYVTRTSHSLGIAIFRYFASVFAAITGYRLKKQIKAMGVRATRRMGFFAIRHPKLFANRVRMALKGLRWLKYLAPLIGTSNKLRGNFMDLLKKWRQSRAADKEEHVRKMLFKQLKRDPKKLEEKAALIVQSAYRRIQAQKRVKVIRTLRGEREHHAATAVQKVLRRKLAEARLRIRRKQQELKELRRKKQEALTIEEQKRLYELSDELSTEAHQLINRKLLMRPNTRFAVTWKILFVVCVLFEIGQLAFSPILNKYVDNETGEKMNIEKIMIHTLVPTPVSTWEQCGALAHDQTIQKKGPGILRFIKNIVRKEVELTTKTIVDAASLPWYCNAPYSTIQGIFIDFAKAFISDFLIMVGVICFLDVFITFFTGELHEQNGTLIPKPFFERWILPGIVLQLLVNPQMETVSSYVWRLIKWAVSIGPVRVWRWTAAFFYPLFRVTAIFFIDKVWFRLVHTNNNDTLKKDPFAKEPSMEQSRLEGKMY